MDDVANEVTTSLDTLLENNPVHVLGAAVVIIVVTAVLAHLATKILRRLMRRDDIELPSASIVVNVARVSIWALGISFMLSSCFKVDVTAAVAAVGIGGIVLSLGLKDTMANLIGGLQVTFMRLVEPGDFIGVGSVEGIVEDVTWRQTVVKDINGSEFIIPNATINAAVVKKIIDPAFVGIDFVVNNDGRDLDAVAREIEARAKAALLPKYQLEREPWVLFSSITDYGMNGRVRYILKEPDGMRESKDAVIRAIAPLTRLNAAESMQ